MGVALENARLFDETQRRARESSALSDVGRDLSSSLDLATVMDRIARHAKDLLEAGDSAIFLPEADGTTFRAIVAHGDAADQIKATTIVAGQGIIGQLLQSGQPELINDTQADARGIQVAGTDARIDERLMVVPLVSGERRRRRDGDLAHGRPAVRPARSRVPGRALAPGHGGAPQRAPVRRDEGVAGAPDRHGRRPQGHQRVAHRRAAGVRRDRRARGAADRRGIRLGLPLRRRADPRGELAWRQRAGCRGGATVVSDAPGFRVGRRTLGARRRGGQHRRRPSRGRCAVQGQVDRRRGGLPQHPERADVARRADPRRDPGDARPGRAVRRQGGRPAARRSPTRR